MLITYGDLVASPGRRPLEALDEVVARLLPGVFNTIHLLPFYPYSSDRGFAVVDFQEVDPRLGTWEDIERLGDRYRLMFDGVFNHVSAQQPLVPALPQLPPRLRELLRLLLDERGDLARPPAADPAPAHDGPADAVPHDVRRQVGLDDLRPRPGRPQLRQPRGAAAGDGDAAALRPARRRHPPPRRRLLHLARARHALRAPRADPRAGAAVPRGARHRRARGWR